MSVNLTIPSAIPSAVPSAVPSAPRHGHRATRAARRSERRRLARHDVRAAQLGELHRIRALLDAAIGVVGRGWVQHVWFSVTDAQGQQQRVAGYDVHVVVGSDVSGACLVGAIVHAAGGPSATRTQLVQRTLDLTWHALHEDERRPVQWCPAPATRAAHVRDLTRWNDRLERTPEQVTTLLHSAVRTAQTQAELVRAY